MKWLSPKHPNHPNREWHRVPFAWFPITIEMVTYWLMFPPYERCGHWRDWPHELWAWTCRPLKAKGGET